MLKYRWEQGKLPVELELVRDEAAYKTKEEVVLVPPLTRTMKVEALHKPGSVQDGEVVLEEQLRKMNHNYNSAEEQALVFN